jgi:hypothetical protein
MYRILASSATFPGGIRHYYGQLEYSQRIMRELIEARRCFDAVDWRQAEERYRRIVAADLQSEEALHRLGLLGPPNQLVSGFPTYSSRSAVMKSHHGGA